MGKEKLYEMKAKKVVDHNEASSVFAIILDILEGKYKLPDFQRCWQWPATNVIKLFNTIIEGGILPELWVWRPDLSEALDGGAVCRALPVFMTSKDACAPHYCDEHDLMVLDGQQRLCALAYLVLYDGAIPFEQPTAGKGPIKFKPTLIAYHPTGDPRQVNNLKFNKQKVKNGQQTEREMFPNILKGLNIAAAKGPGPVTKPILKIDVASQLADDDKQEYGFISIHELLIDTMLRDETQVPADELRSFLELRKIAKAFWDFKLTFRETRCSTEDAAKYFSNINHLGVPLPQKSLQMMPAYCIADPATKIKFNQMVKASIDQFAYMPPHVARAFSDEIVVRALNYKQEQETVAQLNLNSVDWSEHSKERLKATFEWVSQLRQEWGLESAPAAMSAQDGFVRPALAVMIVALYRYVPVNGDIDDVEVDEEDARLRRLGVYFALRMLYFATLKSHEKGTGVQIKWASDILDGELPQINVLLPEVDAGQAIDQKLRAPFLTMISMLRHFEAAPSAAAAAASSTASSHIVFDVTPDDVNWQKHHFYPKEMCEQASIEKGIYNSLYNFTWLEHSVNAKLCCHPAIYLPLLKFVYVDGNDKGTLEAKEPPAAPRKRRRTPAIVDSTISWDNPDIIKILKDTELTPEKFRESYVIKPDPATVTSSKLDEWLEQNFFLPAGVDDDIFVELKGRRKRVMSPERTSRGGAPHSPFLFPL